MACQKPITSFFFSPIVHAAVWKRMSGSLVWPLDSRHLSIARRLMACAGLWHVSSLGPNVRWISRRLWISFFLCFFTRLSVCTIGFAHRYLKCGAWVMLCQLTACLFFCSPGSCDCTLLCFRSHHTSDLLEMIRSSSKVPASGS